MAPKTILSRYTVLDKAVRNELANHYHKYGDDIVIPKQLLAEKNNMDIAYNIKIVNTNGQRLSYTTYNFSVEDIANLPRITRAEFMQIINKVVDEIISA